ncbi:MAG: gluconokinase [Acidobacteriaceae bacterium]|nr:gluconokinase [Acidobacteriaceae bacterium]
MRREENLVGLDLGTSSVRALLFDGDFSSYPDLGAQKRYEFITAPDGSVEVNPDLLLHLTCDCLDTLHEQMVDKGIKAAGVGISTFWHCFLGIDKEEKPTTPVVHLFDTRSGQQMRELTNTFDPAWLHAITGCMPHTSYWPAKLLWLKEKHPSAVAKTIRWLSPGEYLLFTLTGDGAESTSMVSATGLWDQRKSDYCEELLDAIGIGRDQLAPVDSLDEPRRSLGSEFAKRWPLFNGIPWYPAFGDGACNSVGSGCTSPKQFALMVGTSGAMRVVVKQKNVTIPAGIWCYRVNRERAILGGAVSNGGEVFRWITRTLQLPADAENQIAKRQPGTHGLTMLPYFAGERSPYWRPELRAAITGMSLATKPLDILQACLESVSLRFKQIYTLLMRPFPEPEQVIASGGALLRSKAWLQMMTDALGHPIAECTAPEASSRGAAMLAGECMGLLTELGEVPLQLGVTTEPGPENVSTYQQMFERDARLFEALYGAHSPFDPPENTTPLGNTAAPFSTA